jgi:outer membrane protein assembly factor BamB
MRWVATYPRVEVETIAAFNKRQQHGPNPCVFHDGAIFAAPIDGDRLLAYDGETGILKWDHELNGRVHQLLGVAGSRLIAAGDMLWALDVETGQVLWRDGRADPEAATWGRGLLAGDLVYWPRREEIRLVDIATGEVRRQINLAEQHGLVGGGNLIIAGGRLLVAQSNRLVAFSEFGVLKKPSRDELALRRGFRH